MQHTLKSPVRFSGVGLHSGQPVQMVIHPAAVEHGIWFRRSDVVFGDAMIPARWDAVHQSPLCTLLENGAGVTVSTVEHVMAALSGCGVHNALIGDAWARLDSSDSLVIDFRIQFDDAAIGAQSKALTMSNGTFVRELCDSRTFCRQADVDAMRANGLALGGTLENAVVVDGDRILSPGGLRHHDEAVRHKMLDALGDLALAGAPVLGAYTGHRAGHALTNDLLRALFAKPSAYRMVVCDAPTTSRLPGVGVHMDEIPAVA